MADNTKIEWADKTFNPWIGCQKVGPGCDHCYAEAWDARGLQGQEPRWGAHANRTRTSPANWRKPLAWDKAAKAAGERHRVFCASLADVFDNHTSILPEWRADLWALIRATPNLDWMLLTKRPGNIAAMLPADWGRGYRNVWLGCTVVNQAEADRDVPKLLAVPAAVRFLSMEPLLGAVDLTPWIGTFPVLPVSSTYVSIDGFERQDIGGGIIDGLSLVIVGGESGPGARPMHPDWARSLRDQCVAANVAFHFKQWGEWTDQTEGEKTGSEDKIFTPDGKVMGVGIRKYGLGAVEPGWKEAGAVWMSRVGKNAAGRLLDGRTWDEMPEMNHG